MLASSRGHRNELICRRSLVHLPQHFVRSGFRAAKDHLEAGITQRLPGRVGKAGEGVDTRFAPPSQAQRAQGSRDLAGMRLVEEEIIVIEMDRIHSVLLNEQSEM